MRVLALSPGSLQDQLDRLPALASLCQQLDASLYVACDPKVSAAWNLLSVVKKVFSFGFETNPSLADWANLLGNVREPDFQVCINFAKGQQVNLMLFMSHIPNRIAASGFACTDLVVHEGSGFSPQRLASYLTPLGCSLDANAFRLTLPRQELEESRSSQPPGDGPMLMLAPSKSYGDWPSERWSSLPRSISNRLANLRSVTLDRGLPLRRCAAAVACADVVLSSCAVTQRLAVYFGIPLLALGAQPDDLPERPEIRCLGKKGALASLSENEVLNALGF
ncbi:lipopolysaccharide heptosyltransferase family protein [Synechococcus sp. M16CYN]|uniref:glycosyltransferase family 9 protein n=1 Tax=Synechococcus sp. M16CYN TaxID=3103139 RepID=UPI0032506509